MPPLFFYLSGEHDNLPAAECIAILESEKITYRIIKKLYQILLIDADAEASKVVTERAAYTYMLCEYICEGNLEKFELDKDALLKLGLKSDKTFSVRVYKTKNSLVKINKSDLERGIGEKVKDYAGNRLKVKLVHPTYEFIGLVSDKTLIFGLLRSRTDRKAIDKRQGKYRPCFHPGVMHPRIARAMVNLSRIRSGDLFLEPFIGTAGIAIEAGLQGCRILGIDVDKKMIYASIKNLRHYGVEGNLVRGDSRNIPITRADGGATDPPYGLSTSSHGVELKNLIIEVLKSLENIIKPGGYFTVSFPSRIDAQELLKFLRLKIVDTFELYVHRSLTRRIVVLRR